MAQSIDVNLPKSHRPHFPNRCVVCGAGGPGATVRLITGSIGWWTWLFWMFGKPFTVKAPACPSCSRRLHLGRFASLLVTIALGCAALWLIWPHLSASVPSSVKRWAMMGLALLCIAPQLVFEAFFPKPFDITAYSDSVDYEFTDEDLAVDFAAFNHEAEWVKIDGQRV